MQEEVDLTYEVKLKECMAKRTKKSCKNVNFKKEEATNDVKVELNS